MKMSSKLRKLTETLVAQRSTHVWGNAQRKMTEWRTLIDRVKAQQPDNVAADGFKVYSQNDEDGIIEAIFDRIGGDGDKTFIEVGVQDGQECNTHYLLLKDWRGAWIDAGEEYCARIVETLGSDRFGNRFKLVKDFVLTSNVAAHYRDICEFLGVDEIDFYSLDIDGNDLHVMNSLLAAGARPRVVCVEYNGKFPPPLSITVPLDESRFWQSDDYFGASLQAFADLFAEFGYRLVTCSVVGGNAFFVREDHADKFAPITPKEAWHPLKIYLIPLPTAHKASMRYLRDKLSDIR